MMEKYGLQEICPNCAGLIWINLKWPGLPMWNILSNGSLNEKFVCPWCDSVCAIGVDSIISVENMTNNNIRITGDQMLLIDSGYLAVLLCRLLHNQVHTKNSKLNIGGSFNSEEELMRWCGSIVSPIYKSNKLIRLPVLPL